MVGFDDAVFDLQDRFPLLIEQDTVPIRRSLSVNKADPIRKLPLTSGLQQILPIKDKKRHHLIYSDRCAVFPSVVLIVDKNNPVRIGRQNQCLPIEFCSDIVIIHHFRSSSHIDSLTSRTHVSTLPSLSKLILISDSVEGFPFHDKVNDINVLDAASFLQQISPRNKILRIPIRNGFQRAILPVLRLFTIHNC